MSEKIEVENVNSPGRTTRVDRAKYEAARAALMAVLPGEAPGMMPREAQAAMVAHLPEDLFPGGDKVGWWMKCVQLDLEAKGVITRAPKSPVRLWRA
ncbi:hypothetical protein JI664_10070 [Rhodobacter sp. NTK016B]|uniref:DUF6958 family protein n=1 Tax=Rhodobacter sp. NTK016B TaxID=2759676 RepID=UPI001A8CBAF9|nr:hypothetical protein [Rhodobacter sp. NTK016B]MBN8292310.1 hypothetical protein [Rhodobacter sp. NTK016B]